MVELCSASFVVPTGSILIVAVRIAAASIPTTLEGPFQPVTVKFDPSLRQGSSDLSQDDPRIVKQVSGNFPEQISLALSTPDAMWITWITGNAQLAPEVTPLDPSTVASVVQYGTTSGNYDLSAVGTSLVYSQLYPFPGLLNYTSGIIHHVRLTGLAPSTQYFYVCGDPSLGEMSEEYSFTTLPLPSPASYPSRVAIVGDIGLTENSSATLDHIILNDPSILLVIGDLSYANNYLTTGESAACYSCSFPTAPTRETYQPHWDNWGRFMQPLTSKVPMMVIEGNHEIEAQVGGATFISYNSRFSVPSEESGSNNNLYYSFTAGGIYFIMLGGYVDYNRAGAQYNWLLQDLANVDRTVTPWLVAAWHPPWYNSYSSHYREVECMRLQMEDLLYSYRVDIVFSGHVHAYERCNRVYNYTLDACAPLYLTVGDGGNIEQIDISHADDVGQCPSPTDNIPDYGGICPFNFSSGPAAGKYCWDQQPEWSAFRESSFGHGILEVVNMTHALWTWHRNQDVYNSTLGDQIYIVRQPNSCQNRILGHKLLSDLQSHKSWESPSW
ncbi:unnamed protein product [Sphagnum troendelagicum]